MEGTCLLYDTHAAFMDNIAYVNSIIHESLSQASRDSLLDSKSLRDRVMDAAEIKDRQQLREKTTHYVWTTLVHLSLGVLG